MTAGCFAKAFLHCRLSVWYGMNQYFSDDTTNLACNNSHSTCSPFLFFCHFKTEHSIYSSLFNSRLYSREISALPSGLLIISVTSPALWRLSLQLQLYLTSLTCLSLSLSPPLFFPSPTDLLHLFSNYIPLLGQYWRLDHLAFWPLVLSVCLSPLVESVDESMWLRLGWFRRWRNRRIRWMRERKKTKTR